MQYDKTGNIDLTKYDENNPLILEIERTIEEQVKAFNDNYFENVIGRKDTEHHISVLKVDYEKMIESKGKWWGSILELFQGTIFDYDNLGYDPFKVEYLGFDGEIYKFSILFQDRRIPNKEYVATYTGLGQP